MPFWGSSCWFTPLFILSLIHIIHHNPNINISPPNQPFPQAADLSSSARNSASSDLPSSLGLLGVAMLALKICAEHQKQLFCDQGFWRESNVGSFWHHSSYFPASVSKLKKNYSNLPPKWVESTPAKSNIDTQNDGPYFWGVLKLNLLVVPNYTPIFRSMWKTTKNHDWRVPPPGNVRQ